MARPVEKMPRRKTRYDWDEWLDGRTWELVPGEDFTNLHSIRTQAHNAAKERGLKLTTQTAGGKLYIQASPEEES